MAYTLTEKDLETLKNVQKYLYNSEFAHQMDTECSEKTGGNVDYRDVLVSKLEILIDKIETNK